MKLSLLFIALAGMIFLPSCEKHNLLIEEVKKIDAEIKQAYAELTVLDAKLASYGTDADSAILALERQNVEWTRRNTSIEAELATKSKQCTDGEAAIQQFRPKVDAYKAKYLR